MLDAGWRQCILNDMNTYLRDNQQAWQLAADGTYSRILRADGETPCTAQIELTERYASAGPSSLTL